MHVATSLQAHPVLASRRTPAQVPAITPGDAKVFDSLSRHLTKRAGGRVTWQAVLADGETLVHISNPSQGVDGFTFVKSECGWTFAGRQGGHGLRLGTWRDLKCSDPAPLATLVGRLVDSGIPRVARGATQCDRAW
jgi:hypothetical protein